MNLVLALVIYGAGFMSGLLGFIFLGLWLNKKSRKFDKRLEEK